MELHTNAATYSKTPRVQLEMRLLDRHILIKGHHIGPLVVIGSSELSNKVVSYCVMQFGYVAHVFKPERVEPVIRKRVLVELGHD